MSGAHFRDYHLLLDEHADQLFAMTDPIAERVRKIGGLTLRSIGQISRTQRVLDNDAEYVQPLDMLAELADDNKTFAARLREAHNVCDEHHDVATASLIEVWIDETERRTWFLFEATRSELIFGINLVSRPAAVTALCRRALKEQIRWRRKTARRRQPKGEGAMNYRLLGESGLRVSEFCLGTMTFGEDLGWGSGKEEARKIYDAFSARRTAISLIPRTFIRMERMNRFSASFSKVAARALLLRRNMQTLRQAPI